jgi:rubrerythrin
VKRAPKTLEELMAVALAIELDAVQRYKDFADTLEAHNNHEVAALFRTMAGYEGHHVEQVMSTMGWTTPPAAALAPMPWVGGESPEAVPFEDVHYLMQPWHALELALAAEQRAEAFFAELVEAADEGPVREAARQMQAEEAEHVQLVRAWMAKVPRPDSAWADDPDPPRYSDL